MISKEELAELKNKKNSALYYLEKEYMQYIFLHAISKFSNSVIFKGGTCLRLCYGLERASEDLDFSTELSIDKIKEIIEACLKNFSLLGIEYFDLKQKEFQGNIRFEVKLKGPLFKGSLNSANNLKIDFNKNKAFYSKAVVIQSVFSDVPSFVIAAMEEKEILAEKIRAIANRKQARDLYDLWILLGKKVEIDKGLILKKLKEEKVDLKKINIISKQDYDSDLRNLIDYIPPYEQVRKDVLNFISSI